MIQVHLERDGQVMDDRKRSEQDALSVLLNSELGFGGTVIEFTDERIVTKTRVMGCVDVSAFTGTVEEMKNLVLVTAIGATLRESLLSGDNIDKLAARINQFAQGSPFLLEHGSGIMMGAGLVRAVCLAIICDKDLEAITRLKLLSKDDLFALLCLKLFEGSSKEELLDLAA